MNSQFAFNEAPDSILTDLGKNAMTERETSNKPVSSKMEVNNNEESFLNRGLHRPPDKVQETESSGSDSEHFDIISAYANGGMPAKTDKETSFEETNIELEDEGKPSESIIKPTRPSSPAVNYEDIEIEIEME